MYLGDLIENMLLSKHEESVNNNLIFIIDSIEVQKYIKESLNIIYPLYFAGKSYNLNDSQFKKVFDYAVFNTVYKLKIKQQNS